MRLGCLRKRLEGWPLCFQDFDELPEETRAAWRRTWELGGGEGRRAREQWQVAFLERDARRVPLMDIRIPAWQPARPVSRRRRAG